MLDTAQFNEPCRLLIEADYQNDDFRYEIYIPEGAEEGDYIISNKTLERSLNYGKPFSTFH